MQTLQGEMSEQNGKHRGTQHLPECSFMSPQHPSYNPQGMAFLFILNTETLEAVSDLTQLLPTSIINANTKKKHQLQVCTSVEGTGLCNI